jgi:hypothetical protein
MGVVIEICIKYLRGATLIKGTDISSITVSCRRSHKQQAYMVIYKWRSIIGKDEIQIVWRRWIQREKSPSEKPGCKSYCASQETAAKF